MWLRSDSPYKEAETAPRTAAVVRGYRESILLRESSIQERMQYESYNVINSPRQSSLELL